MTRYFQIPKIEKETEKAVAFNIEIELCNLERTVQRLCWIPKSMIKNGAVPGWLLEKKGIEIITSYPQGSGATIMTELAEIEVA